MPPRCYLGCLSDLAVHLHVFPNPKKFPEQFKKWVEIIGGQLITREDYAFFRSKRLCDRHFTVKDRNRNNRLTALAIPSLFLSAESTDQSPKFSNLQSKINPDLPLLQSTFLMDSLKDDSTTIKVTEIASAMDDPLLQSTSLITVRELHDDNMEHQESGIVIPLLETQTGNETSLGYPTADMSVFGASDSKASTSTAPEGHLSLGAETSIASTSTAAQRACTHTGYPTADMSVVGTSDSKACTSTALEGHLSLGAGTSIASTSTAAKRACTYTASTFLEHNYSKVVIPNKYNLERFYNKPAYSVNKFKWDQRQIRSLKQQINSLRKRCTSFKKRIENATHMSVDSAFYKVTKNMTPAAKLFTNMQFGQTHKRPRGRRFSLEEKILSLSLFKRSPKCYSLLAHCFTLPSKKTLKEVLAQIKLGPGLNEKIFEKIKKTVKAMNIEDRLCTIIFDEMSLTPQINYDMTNDKLKGFVTTSTGTNNIKIADHVLVFMVKGIKANFKQPVAYYFTNSLTRYELKHFMIEVIKKVQATGLIILCSVCDQSSVNVGAISLLVQQSKNNVVEQGKEWRHDFYEVSKKKIIPLYDVPHLLKGLRNNLLTKDLLYTDVDDGNKEKTVKWKYFQDIYEADKSLGELRLLHKITEEHVNPEKIKKMRVKTAAQIFSHSVAVMAEHLTARGILNEECRHLIPLVTIIDNLFDSLNSNSFYIPNGKIYKGCVRRSSPHHRLWIKAKILLKSIKFISIKKSNDKVRLVTSTVPTTNNFVKTIEGYEVLWNILMKTYCFDSMMTRHFNQDPVENFFGNIRSYGARNNSPNVVAFEGAFKALLLNNFNSPHSINSNCEKDENNCLQALDFFFKEKQEKRTVENIPEENLEIPEELLMDREVEKDMGQRNYVCGWVITKCLKNIVKGCVTCRSTLLCKKDVKDNDYIKTKEYNKVKKWLTYPSEEAVSFFHEIQCNTISLLKRNVPKTNVRFKIMWLCKTLSNIPFRCHIHKDQLSDYFIKTSTNILINSWCRHINRILSGAESYDGDDEIKKVAKAYYDKHKHNKLKNK